MVPLPTAQCQEAIYTAAVKTAVADTGACAPDDSGVAVTTIGACTPARVIWLAWINQIKVAFCYIFGQLTDILADIVTIQADITEIEAAIAGLPTAHEGTPTFSIDPTMGTGATYTILPGSTDVQGGIAITCGTGPTAGGGPAGDLIFGTPFAAQIYPIVTIGNTDTISRGMIPGFNLAPATAAPATTPVTSLQFNVGVDSSDFLTDGQILTIFWHIGYTS